MRPRDPRRLLQRHTRTRGRVRIIRVAQSGLAESGALGSRQVAEVTVPRAELEKLWAPEHLETSGDGWRARATGPQGSHMLTSMLGATALARIAPGDGEVSAGERVEVELL